MMAISKLARTSSSLPQYTWIRNYDFLQYSTAGVYILAYSPPGRELIKRFGDGEGKRKGKKERKKKKIKENIDFGSTK